MIKILLKIRNIAQEKKEQDLVKRTQLNYAFSNSDHYNSLPKQTTVSLACTFEIIEQNYALKIDLFYFLYQPEYLN